MSNDHRDHRREYAHTELRRDMLAADPLEQFAVWMTAAVDAEITDATAMALATADAAGQPSNRIVLLKQYDEQGFTWFTDYRSHKGRDLQDNPRASLLFYWRELERQVRIDGTVSKVSRAESEDYFLSRPEDSRYSAAGSEQSASIPDRAALEARVGQLREQYPSGDVPPAADWGGYRLQPLSFEFWQGRVGRLHDRFQYRRNNDVWEVQRLQP